MKMVTKMVLVVGVMFVGLVGMVSAAEMVVVADSYDDYSGVQGQNNWYYGSYSDASSSPYGHNPDGSTWQEMPTYGSYWSDSDRGGSALIATQYGGRPSSSGAFWDSVRRWEVQETGVYQVTGVTEHYDNAASGGVICSVYLWSAGAATEVWDRTVLGGAAEEAYTTATFTANAGDYIDLTINSYGNSTYDLTIFRGTIQQVPEPAAMVILLSGGIASLLKGRRSLK